MMKNWNKNSIVFVFAIFFLLLGMRGNYFPDLRDSIKAFKEGIGKEGLYQSFVTFKNHMEGISETSLGYHDKLMDVNSIRENLLGTRLIQKGNTMVVKSDSGSLVETIPALLPEEVDQVADRIRDLRDLTEENGAHFLYLAAPRKELTESMPENAQNYAPENQKLFLDALDARGIPYLSLLDAVKEEGVAEKDLFFYTDHHWTPYTGFVAANCISRELNQRYGFPVNEKYRDIDNYKRKIYRNHFLGSKGKKTGTWFTSKGPDDFELITPDFETNYREEQPVKEEVRKGSFEDTALFKKNLRKDFYGINSYVTYSGGDYRLQILKNLDNPKGAKVLLIRDSYGCLISPFLSLQTSELSACDIRNFEYFVGDPIDIPAFIKKNKPDYVLVLYSGVNSLKRSDGKYDFIK